MSKKVLCVHAFFHFFSDVSLLLRFLTNFNEMLSLPAFHRKKYHSINCPVSVKRDDNNMILPIFSIILARYYSIIKETI